MHGHLLESEITEDGLERLDDVCEDPENEFVQSGMQTIKVLGTARSISSDGTPTAVVVGWANPVEWMEPVPQQILSMTQQ